MKRLVRYFLLLVGVGQLLAVVAFLVQWPPAVALWPFAGTTQLTFIFVASIFAAAAASTLWAAGSANYGALAGIGLDYLTIFGVVTAISLTFDTVDGTTRILYAAISALIALFGLALFLWSRRTRLDHTPPMPTLVRWSFVVFVVGLVSVGGALVFQVPAIIPWTITPQLSVLIGWMFIGAAAYFLYGLLRPSWLNSAGQLLGFLAYDVVLVVPFLTRLPASPPEFLVNLTIYTAVVVYSGVLAAYYLFINGPTRRRTWMRSPTPESK